MVAPSKSGDGVRPPHRRLRAFAFDPSLSRSIETYDINEVTIELPWRDELRLGPVDDYLEVVDYDPGTQAFYAPIDLNDPHLIAQDGLGPSEANPQFHQQMAYAVAKTTIQHFEHALGRRALWAPRDRGTARESFVERLRIYPHGLREANAFYASDKKALIFGYFPASNVETGVSVPGETVFTCLSHDIIAHETTHALLDGLHNRFMEPSNMDVWALHEAFADIVALFQHFTYPAVLRHQIARTRGDLESQNLLGQLAFQFGQAIGHFGALRSAIGKVDEETKQWVPEKPDPERILRVTEPHERGAILVAAVFEAFLAIYKRRIADLLRIATGGTGVLSLGELHPDLVERLAQEASKTARHFLTICIRALDYCPPVDVDFGDYLRALITADADLVTDDRYQYRLAIIDAFRKRGIYPLNVRNLSEEGLIWNRPEERAQRHFARAFGGPKGMKLLVPDWGLTTDGRKIYEQARKSRQMLHARIMSDAAKGACEAADIVLDARECRSLFMKNGTPALEVHSVRPARRVGPDNEIEPVLVVEMTQRRRGYFDPEVQRKVDSGKRRPAPPDFLYRGGCTLLVEPDGRVRYCIYKRILSEARLERMRDFLVRDVDTSLRGVYFEDPRRAYFRGTISRGRGSTDTPAVEPFALLHRSVTNEEVI
jgi:hypothetical protein